MCTAVKYKKGFFGRNLDLEYDLPKTNIVLTPRNYPFTIRSTNQTINNQYAILGIAMVINNYPLYYDGMNEHGLFAASLNFDGFAKYANEEQNKTNLASFEIIPYILGNCKSVAEAYKILKNVNITNVNFAPQLIAAPLHWIIADNKEVIVIEQTVSGLHIYDNPLGVLTNNPDFSYHLQNAANYINISPNAPVKPFKELKAISNGIGTTGLPGGLSSADRFIRATYTKLASISNDNEIDNVTQFFHILNSVAQTRGTVAGHEGKYEITIYSNCYSADTLTLYFNTYNNTQISAYQMNDKNINGKNLIVLDLYAKQNINYLK